MHVGIPAGSAAPAHVENTAARLIHCCFFISRKRFEIEKYGILRKIILYCIILYDKVNTDYRLADSLLSEKGGLYGYL